MIDPEILEDWYDAYDVFIIMRDDGATDNDVRDFIRQLCFTDDEINHVLTSKEMGAELRDYALNDVITDVGNRQDSYDRFINILEKTLKGGNNIENYKRAMSIL